MEKVFIQVEVNGTALELSEDQEECGGYDVLLDGTLILTTFQSDRKAFIRCRRAFEEELANLLDAVQTKISNAEWNKELRKLRGLRAEGPQEASEGPQPSQAPDPGEEFP